MAKLSFSRRAKMAGNGKKGRYKSMIYLDNAATTPVLKPVADAMKPYLNEQYFNPATHYSPAGPVRAAVEQARACTAELIGASPDEIIFTSGGTESDNWAVVSGALASGKKHIITTAFEHPAVLNTCRFLEQCGYRVTYLSPDSSGFISPASLHDAIDEDTALVSVMAANNQIGTIQPLKELAEEAHRAGALFHTDAVQAAGHIPMDVRELPVDLLSASGHKFHAPKGIGFLYVRYGLQLPPYIRGAAQENGMRAGTINVPGIIGMGAAAEIANLTLSAHSESVAKLRDILIRRVLETIPGSKLNGSSENRLPGNTNFSFAGVRGIDLMHELDQSGICVSASDTPSHVLLAIGCSNEESLNAVRMTLGEETGLLDIETVVNRLAESVQRLRKTAVR